MCRCGEPRATRPETTGEGPEVPQVGQVGLEATVKGSEVPRVGGPEVADVETAGAQAGGPGMADVEAARIQVDNNSGAVQVRGEQRRAAVVAYIIKDQNRNRKLGDGGSFVLAVILSGGRNRNRKGGGGVILNGAISKSRNQRDGGCVVPSAAPSRDRNQGRNRGVTGRNVKRRQTKT